MNNRTRKNEEEIVGNEIFGSIPVQIWRYGSAQLSAIISFCVRLFSDEFSHRQ